MKYLSKVNSVEDLKKLNIDELDFLAEEIRGFLVHNISKTGGHLASNLGVVELTIALNYVFDTKNDKLIFDVGHQAYVHKILTGRKNQFGTLRKYKGLSGFPKISESKYDAFDVGHSSTSISVASGFCASRDLKNEDYNVIALIGDGAMTGGMAFEALNNIGRERQKMIVILNDNQMSISENVGAVSKTLSNLRTSKLYNNMKNDIKEKLSEEKSSYIAIKKTLKSIKNTTKSIFVKGQIFEQMGFTYIRLVDGHNIKEIIKTLERVKKIDDPILLHVSTVKGKGYKFAEENSQKFHGATPFDKTTGEFLNKTTVKSFSNVVGDKFLSIMKKNKKVVLVSAAMISGTGISKVKQQYPQRVFDVGICEQHATTFCAGVAKEGLIPVFLVYSTFLQRAYDQILHDVCITKQHVIFMIDRAGIVGADGETHQGIFDNSFLSHMPNMTVLAPKSKEELSLMIDFAVSFNAPISIRYPRGEAFSYNKVSEITKGKSEIVFKGEEILIVCVGTMFKIGLEVYEKLKEDKYNPTLINARFIKPLDKAIATDYINYKKIIAIEENVFQGSFTQNLAYELLKNKFTGQFIPFTLNDEFIEQGEVSILLEQQGISVQNIYQSITRENK